MKKVVERVNIFKFIDFSNRSSHGFDDMKMLQYVLLAFALNGYTSTRELEDYCQHDIRFQFIMNRECPSHMTFHRFIHDDLMMPIDPIKKTQNQKVVFVYPKSDTFFIDLEKPTKMHIQKRAISFR